MRPAVAARFSAFTKHFEGAVEYMYLDVKGWVTVGYGNKIDPIGLALALPFVPKVGGVAATPAEITAEWKVIKDADHSQHLRTKGHLTCAPLTKLKLTDTSILALCDQRLKTNESELRKTSEFQKYDDGPADAQLALLSMAWAMGPAFAEGGKWPFFRAACGTMDFDSAADNCRMSEVGNPSLAPRNRANANFFKNAAAVLAGEAGGFYNRDMLYYPTVLLKPVAIQ